MPNKFDPTRKIYRSIAHSQPAEGRADQIETELLGDSEAYTDGIGF